MYRKRERIIRSLESKLASTEKRMPAGKNELSVSKNRKQTEREKERETESSEGFD